MGHYELSGFEWNVILILPNKSRGKLRVDDRRVLNGIFWVLRAGVSWADLPECHGPPTMTCNRLNRRRNAGVNAIHLGCNDKTIHGCGALPTTVGSTEQPGFTPQGDAPKTALGCIVGEADASVCKEQCEGAPPLEHVIPTAR